MWRFKLLFLGLLLPGFLMASSAYEKALELFKKKQYQEAMAAFGILVTEGSNDRDVYFYLGRAAFELGKYDIAEHAFKEAIRIDPENPRMRLELAATLFALKKYAESTALFEKLLAEPLPETVKTNIKRHLVLMQGGVDAHRKIILGVGLFYDDNVHQSAGSSNVYVPVYDTVVDFGEEKEEGWGAQFLAGLDWKDTLSELPLGVSLWMYDRTHADYSNEDLTYLRSDVSFYRFLESPLDVKLVLGRMYDGGEPYAWDYEGGLEWKSRQQEVTTELGLFWLGRTHQDGDEEKDYQGVKAKSSLQYTASSWQGKLGASFQRDWERYAVRSDVDKAVMALWSEAYQKLGGEWSLGGGYRYQSIEYTDPDAHFLTKRSDHQHQLHASIKHTFNEHWLGELEWRHIRNHSNHAPFDYVKNRTGAWLVYAY